MREECIDMTQKSLAFGGGLAENWNPEGVLRPEETILASLPVPPADPSLAIASTGRGSSTKPAETRAFLLVRPVRKCRACGLKYMVVRWMWWRLAGYCQRRCMRDGVLYLSTRTLASLPAHR